MDPTDRTPSGEVTRLLGLARSGETDALDRLVPLVYDELLAMARRQARRESSDTLHATALVHEAYLKLAGRSLDAVDRSHFLAIAARAMRQVLVDHARRRGAVKRGGGWASTTLGEAHHVLEVRADEMIALNDALEQLDQRQRQVVEMRFFGGMEEREVGEVLGISESTVRRDWTKARAWLYRTLYPEAST